MRPGRRAGLIGLTVLILAALGYLIWLAQAFVKNYLHARMLTEQGAALGVMLAIVALIIPAAGKLIDTYSPLPVDDAVTRMKQAVAKDLVARLEHLRIGNGDIELSPGSSCGDRLAIAEVVERMSPADAGREVIIGRAGSGKSYTVLQIALAMVSGQATRIPLVIALSRWSPVSR